MGALLQKEIVLMAEWVGEIIDEVDRLGITENTLIVIMGDNGTFMQYAYTSGQSDRIYRGEKRAIN